MDGYQQSVKAVIARGGRRAAAGHHRPRGGHHHRRKGYETAIETALGFALQNIVVEDQGCAAPPSAF